MSAITNATRALRGDADRLATTVATVMADAGSPQIVRGTTHIVHLVDDSVRELGLVDEGIAEITYRHIDRHSPSYPSDIANWVGAMHRYYRTGYGLEAAPSTIKDGLAAFTRDHVTGSWIAQASFWRGGWKAELVHVDPRSVAQQRDSLSRLAVEVDGAVARSRTLSGAVEDAGIAGTMLQRTATALHETSLDLVNSDVAAIKTVLRSDPGVAVMSLGGKQAKFEPRWVGQHHTIGPHRYLARLAEFRAVTDPASLLSGATKRPIGASIDAFASQARVLDRIASLGMVRSAEDGAMLVVDKLRALKGIGQEVDEAAGITTIDELGVSLRGVDDSVRGARDVMRGITGQMAVANVDELVPTPNVYVGAVGSVLAHLTGARDAYRAAALVLDAAASDPTHAARLRSAAEAVDSVANRFGDRHAPAAMSVASAALDDSLEQLPRFWRGKAPELSALLPEEELSRTMFTSRIKPEASFARQRVIDSKLADELDLPLERLDGHQITEPGVDPQQATATLFEDLAAQLLRR